MTHPPDYHSFHGRPARRNALAVASLTVSIAGFLLCCPIPIGAILGHMAKRQIAQTGESGLGLATAGIILGYASAAWSLVFCVAYLTGFLDVR